MSATASLMSHKRLRNTGEILTIQKNQDEEIPPAITDLEGKATFKDIPIQNYIIEIKPSKDFQGAFRKYPISNDITFKNHYLVNVEVYNQNAANVAVKVCEFGNRDKILSKSNVFMTLKGLLQKEGQSFNYPLRFNINKECYEGTIVPGEYLLVVINGGYVEHYDDVQFGACNVPLYEVNLERAVNKKYQLLAKNIITGKGVPQAQISISNPGCQLPLEEITDEKGEYIIEIDKFGTYELGAALRNYVPYSRSLFFNRSSQQEMLVPMFPCLPNTEDPSTIRIVLGADKLIPGMELRISLPSTQLSNEENVEIPNFAVTQKNEICTLSVLSKSQAGIDGWCRIYVELKDSSNSFKDHNYDRQLLNPIKSKNYFVGIIFFNDFKYIITSLKFIGGSYWDIGMLNLKTKDFVLMNSWVPFLPSRKEFLKEYLQIYDKIENISKNQISSMFRFDLNSWALPGDNYMLPEVFDGVIRGFKLEVETNKDRERFYRHLKNGVCDVFGNFSFSNVYNSIRIRQNHKIDLSHFYNQEKEKGRKPSPIFEEKQDNEKISRSPIQEIKKNLIVVTDNPQFISNSRIANNDNSPEKIHDDSIGKEVLGKEIYKNNKGLAEKREENSYEQDFGKYYNEENQG